jgi:hypothetical protein
MGRFGMSDRHSRNGRRSSARSGRRTTNRKRKDLKRFLCAPHLETLEPRLVLAVITVNSDRDVPIAEQSSGEVTLRDAIYASEHNTSIHGCTTGTGNDTIQFSSSIDNTTIQLQNYYNYNKYYSYSSTSHSWSSSGVREVVWGPSALYIDNSSHNETLTIDGLTGLTYGVTIERSTTSDWPGFRLFFVGDGTKTVGNGTVSDHLTLQGLTLENGKAAGFKGQDAGSNAGAGGGGGGLGGAILNLGGNVTINRSTLTGNLAVGGSGGSNSGTGT